MLSSKSFLAFRVLILLKMSTTQELLFEQTFTEPCGYPLGGCHCSGPILNLIACTKISSFPSFPDYYKHGVAYIDLYETQLEFLQPFSKDEWNSLHTIDLRNNKKLPCWVIENVVRQRNDLYILSDCNYTIGEYDLSSEKDEYEYELTTDTPLIIHENPANTTPNIPNEGINVNAPIPWIVHTITICCVLIVLMAAIQVWKRKRHFYEVAKHEAGQKEDNDEPV